MSFKFFIEIFVELCQKSQDIYNSSIYNIPIICVKKHKRKQNIEIKICDDKFMLVEFFLARRQEIKNINFNNTASLHYV